MDYGVNYYMEIAKPIGFFSFLIAWGYSIYAFGFFFGVGLGWIPAIVIGFVCGILWPIWFLGFIGLGGFFVWSYFNVNTL